MTTSVDVYQNLLKKSPDSLKPNRVAILLGSKYPVTSEDEKEDLQRLFSSLKIRVLSVSSFTKSEMLAPSELLQYDVVGLFGYPEEFTFLHSLRSRSKSTIFLAFAPRNQFSSTKSFLKISNALILCETGSIGSRFEVARVAFSFFESIVVPSLLNIDMADVGNIAKGIGLAFNDADDSPENIVSRLPPSCLVARSALLHFSCTEDVKLREIYSISKAIAVKQGVDVTETELETPKGAMRFVRRINVKMGIRIRRRFDFANVSEVEPGRLNRRISMTAILFGI